MKVRFFIDPETNLPHIYSHSVEKHEAEEVLRAPGEVLNGRDDAKIALGQTEAGRYLQVVFKKQDLDRFVITAYDLTASKLKAYKRRKRRK